MPSFQALRASLAEHHRDHPQRSKLVELALAKAEEACAELAKFGHLFELGPASPGRPQEYPKVLYHKLDGHSVRVSTPAEASNYGLDWDDKPPTGEPQSMAASMPPAAAPQ